MNEVLLIIAGHVYRVPIWLILVAAAAEAVAVACLVIYLVIRFNARRTVITVKPGRG